MHITFKTTGLEKVQNLLGALSGDKLRAAQVAAINDTAFEVRRKMQDEIKRVFDRPTRYIVNSPFVKMATTDNLQATVLPTYQGDKGVDPQKILKVHEHGGTRRDKRSESALRRVGILPAGYQTAIPKDPYPGSDDGNGNLRGPFLVQLLSYFQAFAEQGYRSNLKAKGYARVHNGTAKQTGRRYFVAYGKLRGGARKTKTGDYDARAGNLAPGIWATVGKFGVRPVLMFVRTGNYKPRLDMTRIAKAADVDNYLATKLRYRIRQQAERAA